MFQSFLIAMCLNTAKLAYSLNLYNIHFYTFIFAFYKSAFTSKNRLRLPSIKDGSADITLKIDSLSKYFMYINFWFVYLSFLHIFQRLSFKLLFVLEKKKRFSVSRSPFIFKKSKEHFDLLKNKMRVSIRFLNNSKSIYLYNFFNTVASNVCCNRYNCVTSIRIVIS